MLLQKWYHVCALYAIMQLEYITPSLIVLSTLSRALVQIHSGNTQ